MDERDEMIRRYFLHLEAPSNSDYYDSVEDVDELVRVNPTEAWEIVKDLIRLAPSDHALAYVAAGPLENLVATRGKEMAHVIREEALQNRRVGDALSRVLLCPIDSDVRRALGTWLPDEPR